MTNKNEFVDFITEQFKNISKRIEQKDSSLAGELRLLSKLLDKLKTMPQLSNSNNIISSSPSSDEESDSLFVSEMPELKNTAVKPVTALRELFSKNPNKKFEATYIRNYLKELYTKGELYTKSKNLLVTTHAALRVLVRQEFITKTTENFVTHYVKEK